MPESELAHDRLDVPEPLATDVGVNVQMRFVEFVVTDRATVPVNPFDGVMVRVDAPLTVELTVSAVGVADNAKS